MGKSSVTDNTYVYTIKTTYRKEDRINAAVFGRFDMGQIEAPTFLDAVRRTTLKASEIPVPNTATIVLDREIVSLVKVAL